MSDSLVQPVLGGEGRLHSNSWQVDDVVIVIHSDRLTTTLLPTALSPPPSIAAIKIKCDTFYAYFYYIILFTDNEGIEPSPDPHPHPLPTQIYKPKQSYR